MLDHEIAASSGHPGSGPGSAGRTASGCQPPLGRVAYSQLLLPTLPSGPDPKFPGRRLPGCRLRALPRHLLRGCNGGAAARGKSPCRTFAVDCAAAQSTRCRQRSAPLARQFVRSPASCWGYCSAWAPARFSSCPPITAPRGLRTLRENPGKEQQVHYATAGMTIHWELERRFRQQNCQSR